MLLSKPLYITISGTMGVGKTTVAKILYQNIPHSFLIEENFTQNQFLSLFYQDMKRWAFHSQTFFLLEKIKQTQQVAQLLTQYECVIQDTPIQQDVLDYAKAQYVLGNMNEAEFDLYLKIYNQSSQNLPKPDLVINLNASVETILSRIKNRSRDFEQDVSLDYLQLLDQLNRKWLQVNTKLETLHINTEKLNIVDKLEDRQKMLSLIIEKLNQLTAKKAVEPKIILPKTDLPTDWQQLYAINGHTSWFDKPYPSDSNGYNQHHFQARDLILKAMKQKSGGVIGILGPMGSGKSALLILLSQTFNGQSIAFFHHHDEKRNGGKNIIKSWGNGDELKAFPYIGIKDLQSQLESLSKGIKVLLIDEWQFCDQTKIAEADLLELVDYCREHHLWLIISGLDFSFKRQAWINSQYLISQADLVIALSSRCSQLGCKTPAIFTQLNLDGKPASLHDELVHIGKVDMEFLPKCAQHHELSS